MMETLDREFLKSLLEKRVKHNTGKVLNALPFSSKSPRYIKDQFNKVLGDFIRNICGLTLDDKALKEQDLFMFSKGNVLSEYIANNVEFQNEDDKYDFVRFINQYLFNQEEIKPIHPFLFNYLKVEDTNPKKEFKKIAQFISDTLVQDNPNIKSIFNNRDTDDILTELILSKMDMLKKEKEKEIEFEPLFPVLNNLYQEDLVYLSKYKDYFLVSFPLITHYYVFLYVCQLILKFEDFTNADFNKIQPLYFTLEWESISKKRKAADEILSYKYVREKAINLFPHIHTISHLSHNSLNKPIENDLIHFIPYSELFMQIKEKGEDYETAFLGELKKWIEDYKGLKNILVEDNSSNIHEAFKVLFKCLKEGMNTDVCKKYGENIEALGYNQFIKIRGSIGKVLSIKHDFLLLLTAVSVKNNRIPLNDLFLEFEKRGVLFDRYSKKEIIILFNKLNILDKKSDSGDAQYVKPIL